ncbi:membrane protein insertase YidC [Nemorincola caseinilytica]|uniref:Membrane protein insertase YidC n=1 Tax=Nemorincola caseinilytica TaxID=2054315 RepID=A0ABP8NIV6_9BACT
MDRNQVIGFSLLAVLLIGYIMYNQHEQKSYLEKKYTDSVAYAKAHPKPLIDSSKLTPNVVADTATDSATAALRALQPAAYNGTEQMVTLENSKVSIQFSTKGAHPVSAMLKAYKTYEQQPLYLFNGKNNKLSVALPVDNNISTAALYFSPVVKQLTNGDKSIDFVADMGGGKRVNITYTLPADGYMMSCSIALTGIPASSVPLTWHTFALPTEKDMTNERMATQVYYRNTNEDNDYFTVQQEEKGLNNSSNSAQWLGFRKQYFSTALIADDHFSRMESKFGYKAGDTNVVAQSLATMELPLKASGGAQTASLRWYIGPNDYRTLKSYNMDMEEMVPLGIGIMSFVKYINRWAIIPIFYLFDSFVNNYALLIVLMTLFIRLILSFFTYKSYLSSAKMRVLKPELDELREKIGDDQQKFGMEQMKLYRSAGVNPLGGCMPMLFQLPILLSIYYIFPSFIEFRQQSFLWVNDLSTYDSIFNFGFEVPFYGDHISLFTLLLTASSLFLALYNRNMTPQDPNNPMLKYMPYIFPIILMGMFNKMAAALTFYYTCSNLLSIVQQFVIQKYFINEKAIHAQIQENKTKPPVQSKWAARLEDMQKMQAERAKTQPPKKK